MGLFNARNLRKAKRLIEKNRHKVGDVVEKAGTQLDKVSKGKTSNVTSKATDAAKKYSTGGVTHHGIDSSATAAPGQIHGSHPSDSKQRQDQAAGAVAGAANAFTNFLNKAADKVEKSSQKGDPSPEASSASGTDSWPAPSGELPRDEFDQG